MIPPRSVTASQRPKPTTASLRTISAVVLLGFIPELAAESPLPSASPLLEELIVTARLREEDLMSVPAAVSVIDGDFLDRTATVNIQQLAALIPALYYNSANPRNTAYTIRGLGSNTLSISAANDGIEPGVGFYVDGVYHGRPSTAAFDFTDIERIEVLRGPQGTLFGKNTTAGAINIVSRKPTFDREANAQVSLGGHGYQQFRAGVSGGLSEQIAGRLSAQFTRRDGTLTHVESGQKINELQNTALKVQLLFEPSETFSALLIADVADFDARCCTQTYLRTGSSLRSAARQFPGLAANLPAHGFPVWSPPSTDIHDRVTDIDSPLHVDTAEGGVSLNLTWSRERFDITSISAWRYWDWEVANDRDFTGIPIQLVQEIPSRQDQYSQELRFTSNLEGDWSYVAGLYAFRQTINAKPNSVYGPAAAYWLISTTAFAPTDRPDNLVDGYGLIGDSRFRMNSYAAFGEVNYAFTDAVTATLGLRHTHEDKHGRYNTEVAGGLPFSSLPDPVTCGALAGTSLTSRDNAKLSLFRPQCYAVEDESGSLSGRANLAWQINEGVMTYVSVALGYKAGGLNMSGLPLTGGTGAGANQPALDTAIIDDEFNRTVEFGLKARSADSRALFSLALFHTTVTDFQANIATPVTANNAAPLRTFPANIPEVRVVGAEIDASVQLVDGLELRASLAFTDGEYADYPAGPCPLEWQNPAAAGGCQPRVAPANLAVQLSNPRANPDIPGAHDLSGLPLAGLSRWVGTLGFDYLIPIGSGVGFVRADWNVRSGYNADTSHSQYTRISGYAVLNGSVGFRWGDGFEAELFVRNALNRDYITALTLQTGNSGLILGQTGDPRIAGVTVRWSL